MFFKYQQRKGFALAEVVIALAITAMILTSLMMVQGKLFKRVMSSTFVIQRVYAIKNMFFLSRITQVEGNAKRVRKVIADPEVEIIYETKEINKDSSLARFLGLQQEVSTGSWYEWGKKRSYSLFAYRFDPPKKEKGNAT
jgi:Tfp pilus assembly major pilin PilA